MTKTELKKKQQQNQPNKHNTILAYESENTASYNNFMVSFTGRY